jgi:histidinol-phosphatase (PHP family)
MWTNYHTHSRYCDGKGELADYLQAAEAQQVTSIGFSSHAPLPFECRWCMNANDLPAYFEAIEALQRKYPNIQIYKGLEVDFIPGVVSPLGFRHQLDYTIGSIHFVDAFDHGKPWEIDGSHVSFLEGLEEIFANDMRAAVTRYFELTRQMISTSELDIVGHIDKIKIQNTGEKFYNESDDWYQQEVKSTLALVKETGAIVEVNTRGIYQKKSSTTYPSPWILELIRDFNIPVTISSDAHRTEDLTNQFAETALLLLKTGFTRLSALSSGSWKAFEFNEKGILFATGK